MSPWEATSLHATRIVLALALAVLAAPAHAAAPAELAKPDCLELRSAAAAPEVPAFERDHPAGIEDCTGAIRPGAQLTSPAWCTISFILTDASGTLYTGTAAHCVRTGQRASANGVGAFGTVISDGALGVDYALIRIDEDKRHLVSPTLCAWGGPVGADPGDRPVGDILLEYGWGSFTYWNAAARSRAHVEAERSPNFIEWHGVGSGGDSGGPVVSIEGYAVGSHTYGVTPAVGVVYEGGPTFARMLASGRAAVPTLTLVTGDPTDLENLAHSLR